MRTKVFVDTDVILDVVLKIEPFFYHSQKVLSLIEKNLISGYTSSIILANCYYIINSDNSKKLAETTISKLRSIFTVLPFTDNEIGKSLNSNFKDFEDGIQYFIAINHRINTMITRNISDFKHSNITVVRPKDFLIQFN